MQQKDALDSIFERMLNQSRIFRDREVLQHHYIPNKLPHREEEIHRIVEVIAPALKSYKCSNLFIYGKTGTGKTAAVKYVLERLMNKSRELKAPVRSCYVNCRLAGTEYRVLSSLCSAVDVKVPFTGLATGEIFERLKDGLNSQRSSLLIVLDEIDYLVKECGDTSLYELTRVNESLQGSRVSIIGISNDLRFKELLDPRVLSSLSEEEIVFKPYNAAELRDILQERAKLAFQEGALLEGALNLCAALAAAEHGDARRALDLLRVAGELAEREGANLVTEEHVRLAERRIEHDRVIEAVRNLPLHSKLVLCSAYLLAKVDSSRATTGDIYGIYCELCKEVGLEPLTQRRVSSLLNELDVIGLLSSNVISMGRYGRTRRIRLGVGRSVIKEAFAEDERLKRLIDHVPRCLAASTRRS